MKRCFNIYYYFKLSRPLNVLISMLSIWVAAIIASGFVFSTVLLLAIATAGLITAGANIINDIFDVEIDRINKPQRLIAAGVVPVSCAWFYFGFSYGAGLLIAWIAGIDLFLFACLFALLLYWYSARLKRMVLWGNAVVSLSTGFAFIYGAMAVNNWEAGVIPAIFAFCFHFGREIIKDMQDVSGDSSEHANTFPIRYGRKKSVLLVNIIFGVLIILTIIPYILNIYNARYLAVVIAGVDVVLLSVSIVLWMKYDPVFLGKISHLLKLDMFIGLLAIFLG
jgi:geranylgeranylglycerol-phosphate geranylgeranyltransferase